MENEPETSNANGAADRETLDYLRGVKSSTCLLLTPSPTTLDFKHPLSEEMTDDVFLALNDDRKNIKIDHLEASGGDSSSSDDSNSVVQDPVSAQLINNISMLDYQTLTKNGDIIVGSPESKLNGSLSISNQKLPDFVSWNWQLIRIVVLWIVISSLIACVACIVTMIISIPKTCNPNLPWHQGTVFYEVFPASFKDSDNDGFGDLKGLIEKLDYIKELGCTAIRLNYIFEAFDYPEQFYNTTSLVQVDKRIGVLKDFEELVKALRKRDMFIILDIPVTALASVTLDKTSNVTIITLNETNISNIDKTSAALIIWLCRYGVNGFYLKNLENFVDHPDFIDTLELWKTIMSKRLGVLMVSEEVLKRAKDENLQAVLKEIDLIDVHLDLNKGVNYLKNKIESVTSGYLWDESDYPWVHWNIGNINDERVSTKYTNNTLTLTALQMVLPGTIGIFYGDEIGLGGVDEQIMNSDIHEHIHNLVTMSFSNNNETDTGTVLPWNHESVLKPKYESFNTVKQLIKMRVNTPTVYVKGICRDGEIYKNVEIRKTEENLVVLERWYPRRNTCVFVGNFGRQLITTDLSSMFYGGLVVGGTNSSLIGQTLYFDKITFPPNSAIILKLEK